MDLSTPLEHVGHGLRGPTPLLRLQGDDRLIALTRRGNQAAYEALVARYQGRLLAFCRHMLASREDAEDVLQEVFAAAFNAMLADDRPINARPWLYRIARNRCLNHLRRQTSIGVDSMDIHLADHGATTADKVHKREEFRQLVEDVQDLPETQRTALLLRELDALSYEQISEAMETTVPSVKSLLVRARVSLAEAAESRLLTCEDAREELAQVAEGLKRSTPPVRRHVRQCDSCAAFKKHLRQTDRALSAIFPLGPLLLLKKFLLAQGAAAGTAGAGAASAGVVGAGAAAGSAGAGGALGAGLATVGTKAAAGLTAAAIVAAGAVEVDHARSVKVERAPSAPAIAAATPPAMAAPVVVANAPQERPPEQRRAATPRSVRAATAPRPPAPAPVEPAAEKAPSTPVAEASAAEPVAEAVLISGAASESSGGAPAAAGSRAQTVATPKSSPAAEPTPAFQPAPAPAPAPAPEASPAPAPEPAPAPAPAPEPSTGPEPAPAPAATPEPAPAEEPAADEAPAPAPEPTPEATGGTPAEPRTTSTDAAEPQPAPAP